MSLDTIITLISYIAVVCIGSKYSWDKNNCPPKAMNIFFAVGLFLVGLLTEALLATLITGSSVDIYSFMEIFSCILRFVIVILAAMLLTSFKPPKVSFIILIACVAALIPTTRLVYEKMVASLEALTDGNIMDYTVTKLDLLVVVIKSVPSLAFLLQFGVGLFAPEEKKE